MQALQKTGGETFFNDRKKISGSKRELDVEKQFWSFAAFFFSF